MSVAPSDVDVHTYALEGALANVHTCFPAEIVRVQAGAHKNQFVDVLPGLQRRALTEDGVWIDETLPVIPMVPVGYMQGGGFFISVPLAVGDIVTVMCAERSLDQWIETAKKGGQRAIVPGDVSMHSLEGAIALPCGPAPRSALLAGVSATDLVIGKDGGARIHITAGGVIHLGDDAGAEFVALAGKTNTEITDLKQQVAALKLDVAAGFGAVTAAGGAPAIVTAREAAATAAALLPPWTGSVAATKVKAD